MKTNKVQFLLILALTLFVGCEKRKKVDSYYSTSVGADIEISDDMERNEYKSDNLLGIAATLRGEHDLILIFDEEKCLFNRDDVFRTFSKLEEGSSDRFSFFTCSSSREWNVFRIS